MLKIEIDNVDLTILNRLNENGRATYSELADELHLTVPTVKSRIEKLMKIGVIHHIGVYLNPHSLTNESAALIRIKVNKEKKHKLIDFLTSINEVREVFEVLDDFNILIMTQIQPLSMHQILFENIKSYSYVEGAKISILLKEVFSNPHRIPKQSQLLNIRCEYCGKQISDNYESEKFDDIRHYFCCTSCLKNYKKWRKSQISV
ncbi:MAG: winged helix-turn-helix transcriptional regulator [Candidatus Heimdallarchaeota archaeon]|nr:MAG: winged helix-turn-helix transcriptional regulator [Candidatus Heimdallarchaeota archaeon]